MCRPRPAITLLRRNSARQTLFNFTPLCWCWFCPTCRPLLIAKWKAAVARHALKSAELACVTCTIHELAALRRFIGRHGAHYAKVRDGDKCVLIVDARLKHARFTFTPVDYDGAMQVFSSALDNVHDFSTGNPVSTSRAWKLPQKRRDDDLELVAVGPTKEEFIACAERIQIAYQSRAMNGTEFTAATGANTTIAQMCDLLKSRPKKSYVVHSHLSKDCDTPFHNPSCRTYPFSRLVDPPFVSTA